MRHDPSTYIGIGENGFRAIEPSFPKHDKLNASAVGFNEIQGKYAGWLAFALIFGCVSVFLVYFFLLR